VPRVNLIHETNSKRLAYIRDSKQKITTKTDKKPIFELNLIETLSKNVKVKGTSFYANQ
jgi:hypothetical protein